MLKTCHSFDAIMLYESIGPPQEETVYVFYLLAGNRRTGLSQDKNSKNLEKTKQTKAVFQFFLVFKYYRNGNNSFRVHNPGVLID